MLLSLFRGRLAPDELYPAGEPVLTARMLQLPWGEEVRVVEGGDVQAPPVLFLHGWGASVYYYRKILPAVVQGGYRVIAMDLRGHGGSDKPRDESLYTADAMAAHVEAVIDTLGVGRLAVVAHSLGGGVALDVARRQGARLTSLMLLAPVGLASVRFLLLARLATPAPVTPLVQYAVPPWTIPLAVRAINGTLGDFAMRDVDEYRAPTRDPAFAWALRTLLHRYRLEPRTPAELAAVTAPVLLMLGGQDLLVRAGESAARVQELPGWRSCILPRAGHVLAEEVPQTVLDALLPHLNVGR
ncbi:MAG: alpha/beta hydrolase [Gemmatimonadaceae bacterium]|nr:alpha/beta hydrolase [Gemmatimonadaceae bacterium]